MSSSFSDSKAFHWPGCLESETKAMGWAEREQGQVGTCLTHQLGTNIVPIFLYRVLLAHHVTSRDGKGTLPISYPMLRSPTPSRGAGYTVTAGVPQRARICILPLTLIEVYST